MTFPHVTCGYAAFSICTLSSAWHYDLHANTVTLYFQECVKFLKEIMMSTNYSAAESSIQHPQVTISSICQDCCPVFIKVLFFPFCAVAVVYRIIFYINLNI